MIKTFERIEVKDYPYGFRLRTTLFDFMDFDKKKGYRHCTETINPKNGKLNKAKKSTYSPLMVRYYDENGHIKVKSFDFNGDTELNKGCKFVAENFDIFTGEEVNYLYRTVLGMAVIDMKATQIYGGSKFEDLKPLYSDFLELAKKGLKEGGNLFGSMILDTEAIEATKPKDFNPFVIKEYVIQ